MKEGSRNKKYMSNANRLLFSLFLFSLFTLQTIAYPVSYTETGNYVSTTEDSPEIELYGNGNAIFSGSATTSLENHTKFGYMYPSTGTVTRTYTISNTGSSVLNISGINIGGSNADQFYYTNPVTSSIAAGSYTTFTVVFDPSTEGDKFAVVNVSNDDTDESTFSFNIDGSGFPPKSVVVSGITSDDILNTCYYPWEHVNGFVDYRSRSNLYIYSDGTSWIIGDVYHPTITFFRSVGTITPSVWDVGEWTEVMATGTPILSDFDPNFDINIKGNRTTIQMDDTSPSFLDHTKFGSINISSGYCERTFTILNTGGGDLNWSTISLGGPDASSFTIVPPRIKSVYAYSYSTFKVTFNPSTVGTKTATVTITSNDTDESPWIFTISGDGFSPKDLLVSGITSPVGANGTYVHMGILNEYQYWKHESLDYYIFNSSFNNQRFWGIDSDLTGLSPDDLIFYIDSEIIDPTGISVWNPAIGVSGSPSIEFLTPEIEIRGNGEVISDGDSSPSSQDNTLFGTVNVESGSLSRDFTILNNGNGALILNGDPVVSVTGTNAADFSVATQPNTSIEAGEYSFFTITFNPLASGTRSAVISIINNDDDENPYTFSIEGTGQTVPTVNTSSISSLSTASVTLNGEVVSDGSDPITERGFVYSSVNGSPLIGGEGVLSATCTTSETGTYIVDVPGLTVSTHYFYRAYATNSMGTSYGDVGEFTTLNQVVSFETTSPINTNAPTVGWKLNFAAEVTGLSASNFSIHGTGAVGSFVSEVSGSGTSWTITVTTGSGSGQLYFGLANSTGLNNGIAGLTVYGGTYFIDKVKPIITSSIPANNSGKMYPGANITLRFDDFMSVDSGKISIYNNDGSLFEQIDVASTSVTINNFDVTINPNKTFERGHSYCILIDTTALVDDAGNYFVGLADNSKLNFSTVDVVINEVVADPQNDWSTNGFNGIPANGAISAGTDEWVELYINSQGIDLTGWTIELWDGTDVTGNLTNSGAFDNSVYIGTGSFSNTSVGDYLVLGNVDGSGAINNTCTINLKDPYGAIVDSVSFGTIAEVNSTDIFDESAQRFPNGSDSNLQTDWVLGPASMAAANTGPSIKLAISESSIPEDGSTATITAIMSGAIDRDVTVELDLTGTATIGEDLLLSGETIEIAAGSKEGSVTVTILPNNIDQNDRTLEIDISSVSLGTEAGEQQVVLMITDDDDPPEVVLSVSSPQITENSDTAYITAELSSPSSFVVGVYLEFSGTALGGGVDYTALSETIAIEPGKLMGTTKLITIPNELAEGQKTIILEIDSVTNGVEEGEQQETIAIIDDDLPKVSISQSSSTTEENGGTNIITATLDKLFADTITVVLNINPSSTAIAEVDYSFETLTITIPPGELSGLTTLVCLDDLLDEEEESVTVGILSCDNCVENGEQAITSTITDDDGLPPVSFASATLATIGESGNITIAIEITSPSGKEITVPITVSSLGSALEGVDFTISSRTMTIPVGSTSSETVLSVIADGIDEENESVIIGFGPVTNALEGEVSGTVVTITDDDSSPVISTGQKFSIVENALNGTEIGTVEASDPDVGDLLVGWAITGGNNEGIFGINGATGELVLANNSTLDPFEIQTYTLQITVSDGTNLSEPEEILVLVTGLNDEPPELTGNPTFEIDENSENGTTVGMLEAFDPDFGFELSWTIISGNTGNTFALSSNGELTINKNDLLDYESTKSITIVVRVSDGLHSDDAEVIVSIRNLNDNPPEASNIEFSIIEGSIDGTFVGKITAVDVDGDQLSYNITDGNTGDTFTIDNSGAITVNNSERLEFDTTPIFVLEVTIGDGINLITVSVEITVIEDTETALQEIYEGNINVYPNPASEFIAVQFVEGTNSSWRVDIFGTNGHKYISKTINGNNFPEQIDINGLKPGLYIIKLTSGDISVIRKLVVK